MASDFSVDPSLNLPIVGGEGSKLDRNRLKLIKEELAYNPRASKPYLTTLTKQFMPGMKYAIQELPRESNLIVMPSSSGRNIVPSILATLAKQQRPDLNIVNVKPQLITAAYSQQSKIKGKYEVLAEDPRRFDFRDEKKISELAQRKQPTFIIDDSVSTGETAIMLQRQLSKRGVYAQGFLAAVGSGRRYSYASDMQRVYDKITQDYPNSYSADQIKSDINTQFNGFPRKKIADFERAISGSDGKLRERAIYYLRQSSEYYRTEGVDPQSAIRNTPNYQAKISTHQQLKMDFPNLSDRQIDRYAKLMDKQQTQLPKPKDQGLER